MTQEEVDKLSREEALALMDSVKEIVTNVVEVIEESILEEITGLDLSRFNTDEEFIAKAIAIDNLVKKIESYL